jgi:hypothetical protein
MDVTELAPDAGLYTLQCIEILFLQARRKVLVLKEFAAYLEQNII